MATTIIRPMTPDIVTSGWAITPLYDKIDEVVTQPTAGGGDYIQASSTATCEITMQNFTLPAANLVSAITIWVYSALIPNYFDLQEVAYKTGAFTSSYKDVTPTADQVYRWNSVSWGGLSLDQTDVNDLRIRIRNTSFGSGTVRVDVAYFILTYAIVDPDNLLRPNSAVSHTWSVGTNPTDVDDLVVDPDAGDAIVVQAVGTNGDDLNVEKFGFPNTIDDVGEVTNIAVHTYGGWIGSASPDVKIYIGGEEAWVSANLPVGAFLWRTNNFAGSWSQSDLDSLEVWYRANVADVGKGPEINNLDVVYVIVTYTPPVSGWGHKFNGVANINIGKINGVLKANIAKVNGV